MASGYVKRFIKIVIVTFACVIWWCPTLLSREAEEYKVKAAFIYNFIKFVQWPESAFPDTDTPYRICMFTDDGVLGQFKAIEGKKNQHRPVMILHKKGEILDTDHHAKTDCHVLFIDSRTPRQVAARAIRDTAEKPVLIIGEKKGFIRLGGSINFFFKDDRLQFEIDPGAAAERGLEISSRLLKLAVIVEGKQ